MEQVPVQPHQICLFKAPQLLQLWQLEWECELKCVILLFLLPSRKKCWKEDGNNNCQGPCFCFFQTILTQERELDPEGKHLESQMKILCTGLQPGTVWTRTKAVQAQSRESALSLGYGSSLSTSPFAWSLRSRISLECWSTDLLSYPRNNVPSSCHSVFIHRLYTMCTSVKLPPSPP